MAAMKPYLILFVSALCISLCGSNTVLDLIVQLFNYGKNEYVPATSPVCMGELGCFNFDGDFATSIWRPLQFAPQSREEINTTFRLYTRSNIKDEQYLKAHDKVGIEKSNFDASKPTKMVVHGLMEYMVFDPEWITEMKTQLLLHDDFNVINVDWRGGNKLPYARAISNTRVVGAEMALLINTLINVTGANASSFHIIGHSLGGQAAGYAGDDIVGLGRITGLDPAGPGFQGLPAKARLNQDDAEFVDVIHTYILSEKTLGLGMMSPSGHFDFYPDGGNLHPGCARRFQLSDMAISPVEAFRKFFSCEHQRSVDFFIASLNSGCKLVGYNCPSYNDFKVGKCFSCGRGDRNCPVMGIETIHWNKYKVENKTNILYLETNDKDPFCKPYYAVVIELSGPNSGRIDGDFTVEMFGETDTEKIDLVRRSTDKYSGNSFHFLGGGDKTLGPLKAINLIWTPPQTFRFWSPLTLPTVQSVQIKQMHMLGKTSLIRFCAEKDGNTLHNQSPMRLSESCMANLF